MGTWGSVELYLLRTFEWFCSEHRRRGMRQKKVSKKEYLTPKTAFPPGSRVQRQRRRRVFRSTRAREMGESSTCSADRPASQGCLKVERRAALRRESRAARRRCCSSFRLARGFFWARSLVFSARARRHHPLNCEKNLMRLLSSERRFFCGLSPKVEPFLFS